jgi:HSP20 family protein
MKKGEIGEELEKLKEDIQRKGEEIEGLRKKIEELNAQIRADEDKGKTTELADMLGEVSDLLDASFSIFGISGSNQGAAKISGGLVGLINNLAGVAERSDSFQKKFDLNGKEGVIDFHIRSGPLKKSTVKSRGINIKKQMRRRVGSQRESPAQTTVKPIKEREPIVDIFEEDDMITVMVELPGVLEKDITWEVEDNILTIGASTSNRNYFKEIILPKPVEKKGAELTYRNGILEIKLRQKQQESTEYT